MSTIVTRAGKGAPLNFVEGDANFTNLNTDKVELTNLASTSSASLGDFLVGVKRTQSGAMADTLHAWINRSVFYVKEFNATEDGVADDQAAFAAAAAAANSEGGGVIYASRGKTYKLTAGTTQSSALCAIVLKNNTILDLQGATLNITCGTGSQTGVWLYGNRSQIINGTVNLLSTGSPSAQYWWHCPVVGGIYNDGDSAGTDPANTAYGIQARNLTLSNNRTFGPCIQFMGGVSEFWIDQIKVSSSATCSGVHLDWSNVGTADPSANQLTRMNNNKTAFNAGTFYTTHPNNGTISNIHCGSLTVAPSGDLSAHIVRLSACHSITMYNLNADRTSGESFLHVGGDLGYEFAPATVKPFAYKGISLNNIIVKQSDYHGIYIDTYADNVDTAVGLGYTNLLPVIQKGDIRITGGALVGKNSSGVGDGVRLQQAKGVTIKGVHLTGFALGVGIEDSTAFCSLIGNTIYSNMQDGMSIKNAAMIKWNEFVGNEVYSNGTDATYNGGVSAGIRLQGGEWTRLWDNIVGGESSEATQNHGIRVGTAATNTTVERNLVRNVQAGGVNYPTDTSTDNVYWIFRDNKVGNAETYRSGQVMIPVERNITAAGKTVTIYRIASASLSAGAPPGGGIAGVVGDRVLLEEETGAAGTYYQLYCRVAGTPGTWITYGVSA